MSRVVQKVTIEKMEIPAEMGGFGTRVETGAVEFTYPDGNRDWSGYFIRGDNAFNIVLQIKTLEDALNEIKKKFPEEAVQIGWPLMTLVGLKNDIVRDVIEGEGFEGLIT